MSPRLTVVAGTGGVGKTTLSAAMGRAFADAGRRTLVVTVDPARRLADALGVTAGDTPTVVQPGLSIWMPEARAAFDQVTEALLEDPRPFRANPVTAILRAAPAGIHEIAIALSLAAEAKRYDDVVLDTAPSAHALGFLDTPGRLADLLERRALRFFMAFGGLASRLPGQGLVERAMRGILPAEVIGDGAAFFAELAKVGEPLATRARRAQALIDRARFTLVAGVTPASQDGATFLRTQLEGRGARADRIILNRMPGGALERALAKEPAAEWHASLAADAARERRWAKAAHHRFPDALRIPELDAEGSALAEAIARHLGGPPALALVG